MAVTLTATSSATPWIAFPSSLSPASFIADTSPAMHTISRFDVQILETHYTEETELVVGVRRSETEAFIEAFVNALGGRGAAERA